VDDRIREGLKCLQLSDAIFLRAHLTAPWCYESPEHNTLESVLRPAGRRILLFHVFTEGQCRVHVSDGTDLEIAAGDIVVFPFAHKHCFGDPELADPVDLTRMLPPPP
jgi:hypothetical protein